MRDHPGPSRVSSPRLRIESTRCTWRSLGDQIIVLDLTGSAYFELNHTAALLWPALVDGTDEPTLVRRLDEAGAADGTADVRAFLDELRLAGLLSAERAEP